MRIISGKFKGRRISPPSKIRARPTTDFAKEGLFNLLQNELEFEGKDILDLFAGAGGISLEFASRGVATVTCVEKDKRCVHFIQDFIEKAQIDDLKVIKADVFKVLRSLKTRYDLVFADPPYALKKMSKLPDIIADSGVLKEGGMFIIEHGPETDFTDSPYFKATRTYGNVNFSFFGIEI